jgi:hypothetical protein
MRSGAGSPILRAAPKASQLSKEGFLKVVLNKSRGNTEKVFKRSRIDLMMMGSGVSTGRP